MSTHHLRSARTSHPTAPDATLIARGIEQVLAGVGFSPLPKELAGAPEAAASAWVEITSGYHANIKEILSDMHMTESAGLVLVGDIPFQSMCPHHLLPYSGTAHVGYLPSGRVVGLSRIVKLVQAFARRLILQEDLGQSVADSLVAYADARGAGVVIEATHACMAMRGTRTEARIHSEAFAGALLDDTTKRTEFLRAALRDPQR